MNDVFGVALGVALYGAVSLHIRLATEDLRKRVADLESSRPRITINARTDPDAGKVGQEIAEKLRSKSNG